jgi:hypothetical protein
LTAVRTRWHAPGGKGSVVGFGGRVFVGVIVIIAVVADKPM